MVRADRTGINDLHPVEPPAEGRIVSRQLRHFPLTPPRSRSSPDDKGTHYILGGSWPATAPGLLARIAYVLAKANVNVASAKINTLGEQRVE